MKNCNDKDLAGRLVYLTRYLEKWYKELNPTFNVPITNRLAKVVKVFDWSTEEGKLLLAEREKTGKWKSIDPKLFKFVLKVYYPELIIKKSDKVMIEEVVPRYYPGTEGEMFRLLPEWMLKDLVKEEKNSFTIVKK
jgi:hypothetical protein